MRILLTGANGFIGRYLLASLLSAGHDVVPAVRRPAETDRLLPHAASVRANLNIDITPEAWLARLAGIDAVINCAGVLQGGRGQSINAIHAQAPPALFEACQRAGVPRFVQISAISVGADTAYAKTKGAADDYLAETSLDWVILRPSIVYAPGAYGGTALFRALSAFPFFIPVPGNGRQPFQPIHIQDLCETILRILADRTLSRVIIVPVGPERLTLRDMFIDLRRWLGFASAPVVSIPLWLVQIAATFGNVFGGSINETALRQLEYGNAAAPEPFIAATGIQPRRWRDALLAEPAQVQDRWHARLYLLRPLLRLSVALTWLWSGCAQAFSPVERCKDSSRRSAYAFRNPSYGALVCWISRSAAAC